MAWPRYAVSMIRYGAMTFGSMCRRMIRRWRNPVARGRPRQHRAVIRRQRVVGRDHVGAEPHEDVDRDDDGSDGAQWPLPAEVAGHGEPASTFGDVRNVGDGRSSNRHQRKRIRGSSQAYIRSTAKLTKMKTNATSITTACVSV